MNRALVAVVLLLPACYSYKPPPPAPLTPREALEVDASQGQTWDAVIDFFAARSIPIRTIERASGLLASDALSIGPGEAVWASCGVFANDTLRPNWAIYNVLVRGDSTFSTIRTTVRWTYVEEKENRSRECTSTHVWERQMEDEVKSKAEGEASRYVRRVPATPAGTAEDAPEEVRETSSAAPEGEIRSYAPRSRAEPEQAAPAQPEPAVERGAGALRKRNELLRYEEFRIAITDAQRLGIIGTFDEMRIDTLTVELDLRAATSPSTAYNLGRVYRGYSSTTAYSSRSSMELRRNGRTVGEYSRAGLTWR